MSEIQLQIDGKKVTAREGMTLLEAATFLGFPIPTLCHLEGLNPYGACRLCVVDMSLESWDDDWFKLVTACNHPVEEGMTVITDSERVRHSRRMVLELLGSGVDLGQADAAIADAVSIYQFTGENGEAVRIVGMLTDEPYVIAARIKSPRLSEAINEALIELRESGALEDFVDRWF